MSRKRVYKTNAERQAAYRERHQASPRTKDRLRKENRQLRKLVELLSEDLNERSNGQVKVLKLTYTRKAAAIHKRIDGRPSHLYAFADADEAAAIRASAPRVVASLPAKR